MSKIPTAEEFCKTFKPTGKNWKENFHQTMVEFTKFHVKKTLEAANKTTLRQDWIDDFINLENRKCKKAIMNSYPKELIK
jgi:hypothetical protein